MAEGWKEAHPLAATGDGRQLWERGAELVWLAVPAGHSVDLTDGQDPRGLRTIDVAGGRVPVGYLVPAPATVAEVLSLDAVGGLSWKPVTYYESPAGGSSDGMTPSRYAVKVLFPRASFATWVDTYATQEERALAEAPLVSGGFRRTQRTRRAATAAIAAVVALAFLGAIAWTALH